jgi:hypothetical protein
MTVDGDATVSDVFASFYEDDAAGALNSFMI